MPFVEEVGAETIVPRSFVATGRPKTSFYRGAALTNTIDRIINVPPSPVPIARFLEFPTPKALRAAASEINKDIRDELTDKRVNATVLQLARVRVYKETDPIVARLVAATGMNRRLDHIVATNEVMDNFAAVLHEPVADAFYQAGVKAAFRHENRHCTRTEVWGRFKRIVEAGDCTWTKAWDEPEELLTD